MIKIGSVCQDRFWYCALAFNGVFTALCVQSFYKIPPSVFLQEGRARG